MTCCRHGGSYGGSKGFGQYGEGRMQTSTQKRRANRPEQNVDVKPSGIETSSAPGQCRAVEKLSLFHYHTL